VALFYRAAYLTGIKKNRKIAFFTFYFYYKGYN